MNPKAEIIAIGDELLIGHTLDSNSKWLAEMLAGIGVEVVRMSIIPDQIDAIIRALRESSKRASLITVTGGLGPTLDDLTKQAFKDYFKVELKTDETVLNDIKGFFTKRDLEMISSNERQADVPANCRVIRNSQGTAPGMWFDEDDIVYISMPGVPFEMKPMFEESVLQKIIERFDTRKIHHRKVQTAGIAESFLAESLSEFEDKLPDTIRLAYLPRLGQVTIRLTATENDGTDVISLLETQVEKLRNIIPEHIFGFGDDSLEKVIGDMLREKNLTLSTAESCTGGFISHLITSIPGSSDYYSGSIISYKDTVKINQLGVKSETLNAHGEVSEETVVEMAQGAMSSLHSDFSIAVSGIAGPGGEQPGKPVGTVWIAIGAKNKIHAELHHFNLNRTQNIELTAVTALNMLRAVLLHL
ncbi:MAG: competence/damage-inducible protein A [Bacteroidetes bacterium]|nr:competence/damage-inducible protein A [Bacteroidota bacterium]